MKVIVVIESGDRELLRDAFVHLGSELRRFLPAANIKIKFEKGE